MSAGDPRQAANLTCDEVTELSGLYVLDALDADESAAVRAHLATCSSQHLEVAEVGAVVPVLAELWEPVDAPPELRDRVMAAVGAPVAAAATGDAHVPLRESGRAHAPSQRELDGRLWEPPTAEAAVRWRSGALSWAAAAAAVMIIAVLGAWNVVLQVRTGEVEQRAQTIAQAIAASTSPDADVATLRGSGAAEGATGFAAFPAEGDGFIVLVDLPPAPAGQTYQAWYLIDGQASSAGLLTVGSDGYAVLSGVDPRPGTQLIALTIEPAGGLEAPSSEPVVAGELPA